MKKKFDSFPVQVGRTTTTTIFPSQENKTSGHTRMSGIDSPNSRLHTNGKDLKIQRSWLAQNEQDWIAYKGGDQEAFHRLVLKYLPLVKYIAERLLVKLPQFIELDDLKSAGVFGLIDALEGFDLNRGVKFESYATTRIRGSMLDELREQDWVPRIVRTKKTRALNTAADLCAELGRMPTHLEIANVLGISLQEYEKLLDEIRRIKIDSLTDCVGEDTAGKKRLCRQDLIEDKKSPHPQTKLFRQEMTAVIMRGLSRNEKYILILYYYEDLTMREIGVILKLSESRICQIHARTILRLYKKYKRFRHRLMAN